MTNDLAVDLHLSYFRYRKKKLKALLVILIYLGLGIYWWLLKLFCPCLVAVDMLLACLMQQSGGKGAARDAILINNYNLMP